MENDGKEDYLIPNYQRAPVKFVRGQVLLWWTLMIINT